MNILHLSAVKSWGGGEKHIENLCLELKILVSDVSNSIFCVAGSEIQSHFSSKKFNLVTAPLLFKMDPRYFLKLAVLCKRKQFDLIHIHDSTALTLAIMADKLYDLPPFVFSKKTSFPIRPRNQTLFKYNYPKIKKILCVSRATLETAAQNIQETQKLVPIYHGTSLRDKRGTAPFNIRERLKLDEKSILIGNIANHIWPKNLEIFIECANEIINERKIENLHFLQIGSFTRLTQRLKNLLKKYKLQEKVTFMGYLPNAANFIPQFNVSLMTSESEGVPQFIYESFYYEVPVVSTAVGGIPEVIEHQKNGFLAKKGDYKTLAEQIIYLMKNEDKKEKFTKRSKKRLHNQFTSEMMATQTLKEYKKAVDGFNKC